MKQELLTKRRSLVDDNRGVLGLDIAKQFMIALMVLLIIGVTVLIVLNSLGDTSVVSSDNETTNVINNGSSAIEDFFSNTGTWVALLVVVVIILILAVVIRTVTAKRGEGGFN